MAEVVLFHHAQGVTPGITAFADTLGAAGHTVHVPDLFDGRTFASIGAGLEHVGELGGMGAVIGRAQAVAADLPERVAYVGFSLGVVAAQTARADPRGRHRGGPRVLLRPSRRVRPVAQGVPVQVHGMDADPLFVDEGDLDAARALVEAADDAELFLYPGDQHYFADSSLPSYDAAATALLTERVLALLARV